MIWEILVGICLIIGLAITIKRSVRQEKDRSAPIGVALLMIIVSFISYSVVLNCTIIPISCLNPIESKSLEEINGYYVLESDNGKCYFVYDGNLVDSGNYYFIDIDTTTLIEPTVYKCNLKHTWGIPLIFTDCKIYYVIVSPNEMIKKNAPQEQYVPDWL